MRIVTDLHVHSKYSRATSKALSPEGLLESARIKGIDVLGTGDFTHPKYLSELKEKLTPSPDKPGFFCLKDTVDDPTCSVFMLSQEISCIYSQGGSVRRNHILITAPDFKTVDIVAQRLGEVGNLSADGRPILGMSSEELAKIVFDASGECMVIPAHIWTPWFSLFGSKSGFDSIHECFGTMAKHILAVETGLSSDPPMNWRIKELDDFAIVSHGDAHSPRKVGREGVVYELEEVSYRALVEALKNSARLDKKNLPKNYIAYTIEFYPEEGKYHWDGHRLCNVQCAPEETKKHNGLCPKCRKPLTVGVEYRVETLATRTKEEAVEYAKQHRPEYKKIVPLEEIIADAVGQHTGTKKVLEMYNKLIERGGNEFNVLLKLSESGLKGIAPPEIAEGIFRVRAGNIHVSPGYDGVFGKVKVFTDEERSEFKTKQQRLF